MKVDIRTGDRINLMMMNSRKMEMTQSFCLHDTEEIDVSNRKRKKERTNEL